ncbi:helix-turn-helix transcriptional regulator [Nonomuraea sp. MCN248]|uniref:Helix-turn-helix transcriptional regulator n=1 Tax=Nonomuraea corallina TaxID=2989783 RepID=A0ABT4S4S0_9ACTN|nr:helix-turn-helix transcriptional regulator [Nonomuraea corallina]MDA0632015.1 helix-turn-helix transcriptional regulator [Nonomuraea corallina]
MAGSPRMTLSTMLVLHVLLSDPAKRRYGLELCEKTRQHPGTVYPILARLEREFGWLERHEESPAEHLAEGRRARHYYLLTDEGAVRARAALDRAERSRAVVDFRTATS